MQQNMVMGMTDKLWLIVGFMGQALFTSRFLVQWIASERLKKSVIPTAFWWLSIGGGVLLFLYALSRHDPVFSLGQGMGLVVYLRNLMLIRREARRSAQPLPSQETADASLTSTTAEVGA